MLLRDKVAVVMGGGQTPGETIGNGNSRVKARVSWWVILCSNLRKKRWK
jgi:hypothetical protein